jgi:hypothetical protein
MKNCVLLAICVLVFAACQMEANNTDIELTETITTLGIVDETMTKGAGENLAAVLARIAADPESFTNYIIDLNDFDSTEYLTPLEGSLVYTGVRALTITLKNSGGVEKTITLSPGIDGEYTTAVNVITGAVDDRGSLFTVGRGVELYLDGAKGTITLDGINSDDDGINNNAAIVYLDSGGLVITDGVTITGNTGTTVTAGAGGGVYMTLGATGKMAGGAITNNGAGGGGGVYVTEGCIFTMNDGIISGNKTTYNTQSGGGVLVRGGIFNMNGGSITNNSAFGDTISTGSYTGGGGVFLSNAAFTMTGGSITHNYAVVAGGGIQSSGSTTMKISGGTIRDNTALRFAHDDVFITANAASTPLPVFKVSGETRIGYICLEYIIDSRRATITIDGDLTGAGTIATINLVYQGNNAWTLWNNVPVLSLDPNYPGTVYTEEQLPESRFVLGSFFQNGTTWAARDITTGTTKYHLERNGELVTY